MKIMRLTFILNVLSVMLLLSSCSRPGDQVWDDTKSCGRHVKRGLCSLGGKQGESRQVRCREEFMPANDACRYGDDFIPLIDNEHPADHANFSYRQPKDAPGDPGSVIPGIEAFRDPSSMPKTAGIFKNIRFPHDSNLIKGTDNITTLNSIAAYMKKNPNTYIFIEGHCDERGAEAYNLPLGARRANAVRTSLIKEGVNPDNIFTISYGKERILVAGHNEDAWAQNRRAEFKIFESR